MDTVEKKTLAPKTLWKSEVFGFSQGIQAEGGKLIFISGQSGIDANVKVLEGFETQCRMAFDGIESVLKEAGATFDNVVKINGYLIDLQKDLMSYTKIAGLYFKGVLPAQTLIEVNGLALPGMLVEVEAFAVL